MKKLVNPKLVALAGFIATYLLAVPQVLASESLPNFPLLQIEGLRFDTPIPLTSQYGSTPGSLNFLSSLKFGAYTPVVISTDKVSESISDILVPNVTAAESPIDSAAQDEKSNESTASGELGTDIITVTGEGQNDSSILLASKKTVTSATTKSTSNSTLITTGSITPLAASTNPSPTSKPTTKPTAKPTSKPTTAPTEAPNEAKTKPAALSNGGLNADVLFDMSNNFRTERGLAPFTKDDRACALAASRAPEIGAEISEGHMHSGLRARNLPYWNSENIISMRSEAAAFNWWVNDKIHHDQIVGDYKYSCVACDGNNCAQEFTNFVSKR